MSWQKNLMLELLLIIASAILSSGEEMLDSGRQDTAYLQLVMVASADPTNPTSQTTRGHPVGKSSIAARTAVRQSEAWTDQTVIHRIINTSADAQRTAAQPRLTNLQKMSTPALSTTMGNASQDIREEMEKPHTQQLSAQTTPRENSTAHSNVTSGGRTTAPVSTSPVGPTLNPKPSPAAIGAYNVSKGTVDCIKAKIGLTMIVKDRKKNILEYFNIDPNATYTMGICETWLATLKISFQGGFIRFSFIKNGDIYYVGVIEATLIVPSEGSPYGGIKNGQLFSTQLGNCFKCLSKQTMDISDNLQLLVFNSQLQAFKIIGNEFGKEEECALDRNKKLVPVTVGLSFTGLFIILLVTYVIYRKKPRAGYNQI